MEMIIGGAFQGKLDFAQKQYPKIDWIDGKTASEAEILSARGIAGFQNFIRRELQEGKEVKGLAARLIQSNPNVVLISEEVGYGVVPVDAFERQYRESVGRVCTELATFATKVTRVVCGIGMVIKDA